MVDDCLSKLDVVPGMPQGSVVGPLWFLLYTLELFSILENKLIGYADDSIIDPVHHRSGSSSIRGSTV